MRRGPSRRLCARSVPAALFVGSLSGMVRDPVTGTPGDNNVWERRCASTGGHRASRASMLARSQIVIATYFYRRIFMKKSVMAVLLILAFCCMRSVAQDETPRYTFNIGGGPGWPQGDVSNF